MIIPKINRKTSFSLGLVALFLIGGVVTFLVIHHRANTYPGTAGISKVNYDPPTKEEQQAGNSQKPITSKQEELNNNPTPVSRAIILISDANYYSDDDSVEVRAYITNIVEDGGHCTATFIQGT